jgi:hypothetical protein
MNILLLFNIEFGMGMKGKCFWRGLYCIYIYRIIIFILNVKSLYLVSYIFIIEYYLKSFIIIINFDYYDFYPI